MKTKHAEEGGYLKIGDCFGELITVSRLVHDMIIGSGGGILDRITVAQERVVRFVFENKDRKISLKTIAEQTGVTSGAVSQTVDLLVRNGIVERHVNPDDRRSLFLCLTETGIRGAEEKKTQFSKLCGETFADIGEREQDEFVRMLRLVYQRFRNFSQPCAHERCTADSGDCSLPAERDCDF